MTIAARTVGAWPRKTSLGGAVEEDGLAEDMAAMDVVAVNFVFKATEKKVVDMEGCRKRAGLGRLHQLQGRGSRRASSALVVPPTIASTRDAALWGGVMPGQGLFGM